MSETVSWVEEVKELKERLQSLEKRWERLQQYCWTLQVCHQCGHCFQNREQMYHGKKGYCKKCRYRKRLTKDQNVHVEN